GEDREEDVAHAPGSVGIRLSLASSGIPQRLSQDTGLSMATPADAISSQTQRIQPWQAVLDFWFGAPESDVFGMGRPEWFRKSDACDEEIRTRFGALHAQAVAGALSDWAQTPLGACALIVVLDQFSRNLFRGKAEAFAGDAQALAVARRLVEAGDDQ